MIGVLTTLLLLSGQAATPPAGVSSEVKDDVQSKVDSVTITAAKRGAPLPRWSTRIEAIGWPFLGVAEERSTIAFAKTGKTPAGQDWQRVWVRHEFREAKTEAGLAFRSERMAQDVDCKAGEIRSLAVFRYPENNLKGAETAFTFEDRAWVKPEPGALDESVIESACMTPERRG